MAGVLPSPRHLHLQALKALAPAAPIQGRVVFTDAARFPKGVPEGVSTVSTLRVDLKPLCQSAAVAAELQAAWSRIVTAARTDRARRKAHLAARRDRHGRDGRKVIAVGLVVVAAVWLAARLAARAIPPTASDRSLAGVAAPCSRDTESS